MKVGPEHWRMVTTDSAGVPVGGPFGNVRWFERAAGRHGLKVCWSRLHHCFGLYTRQGVKPVFQMLLRKSGQPIPMNRELLSLMVYVWSHNRRQTQKTIETWLRAKIVEDKYKALCELQRDRREQIRDAAREVLMRRGVVTPKMFFIPKEVGRFVRRKARMTSGR